MTTNYDIIGKTKHSLDSFTTYLQAFACLALASILVQAPTAIWPQNIAISLVTFILSAYVQIGLALFCLEIYNGKEIDFGIIFSRFNGIKPIVFMGVYVIIILLGLVLLIIPGIILGLMYSQVFYILAENPQVGLIEAFNKSERMMKKNKGQLFSLNLEFLFYIILGVFTFFIWWIWLLPRYSVAIAGFYEELKKNS